MTYASIKSRILINLVLTIFLLVGCKKKETETSESPVQPINFDLPLVHGRNLDSLNHQKYEERILAFSIELGYRSTDFNKRLGLIISAKKPDDDWKALVQSVIQRENYQMAEQANVQYLDSLSQAIAHPNQSHMESHEELIASYQRLINNYAILRNSNQFTSLSALLDSVLSNELAINQSLKNFETQIKNSQVQ